MAHFTRAAVLAESLAAEEWEVYFWTPERFHRFLRPVISRRGDLRTQDPNTFLHSLAHGSVLYTAETVGQYVRDELELFKQITPDLVVGDYRLSLCISAPVSGVPFASIYNSYWSPYVKQPAIIPELPITHWISPNVLNGVYAMVRPLAYARHAAHINRVRRLYGLPRISHDIRDFLMAGDLVLYPDIPELSASAPAPHHHFVGPCLWTIESPKPSWWSEVMDAPEPKVLVALGSSGPIQVLPALLAALSQLPVKVMVVTSGRDVGEIDSTTYVADFLPYEETAAHCAFVVSHGGSSALYPTLSAGTPVFAIPSNIDTHLASAMLDASGAGMSVRAEHASQQKLRHALQEMLSEPKFKEAAVRWAATIANYDSRQIFPGLLRRWFAEREPGVSAPC